MTFKFKFGLVVLLAIAAFSAMQPMALNAEELLVANGFGAPVAYRVVTNGGKVTASINMGVNPFDVAVTPDSKTAYASRPGVNDVAVINLATNTVSAGIALGTTPRNLAMNAAATRLYVATSDGVTAVDIALQPDGSRPNSIVVSESISLAAFGGNARSVSTSGAFLAIGSNGYMFLFDISAAPPVLLASRFIGQVVNHVMFAPGGTKVYAALEGTNNAIDETGMITDFGNLFIMRVSTLAVKSVVPLGSFPLNTTALFNQYLYVTSIGGELWSLDTSTGVPASPNPLIICCALTGIAASTNIFVGNGSMGEIQIVRTGRTPTDDRIDGKITLPSGSEPRGIAVIPRIKGKP